MLGESVRRRQSRRPPRARPRRASWKAWAIGIPIALLLPFAIGYLLAVFILFPAPEASDTGIAVPDLIGRDESEAQRLLADAGLGVLETTMTLPHPNAPAGQVVAQSPLPGQQQRAGAGVQVALSAGRARVVVPDVIGFSADAATSLLQRSGFEVITARQESAGAPGRVVGSDPAPGQIRELPATVTILVSVPLPVDTVPPDTGSVPRRPGAGP